MKLSRQWLTVILIVVVIGGIGGYKYLRRQGGKVKPAAGLFSVHVKGNPAAPVKIVEYTDFQCPACANANRLLENIFKQYEGKIFLEYKHFPLPKHPHARRAAVFAECAGEQGRFWPLYDVLYKSQSGWAEKVSVDPYFSELAVSLGVNGVALAACVNSPEAEKSVRRNIDEGNLLQVTSTPTFFVNGKRVIGGPLLVQEIENILGKK